MEFLLVLSHCLDDVELSALSVVVETNKLDAGGQSLFVSNATIHPDWGPDTNNANDIAIIKLSSPVTLGPNVGLVTLPSVKSIPDDTPCTISGWGTTSYSGDIPNHLQYLNVTTVSLRQCQAAHIFEVYETNICTLTRRGEGACHGDSGGPLVLRPSSSSRQTIFTQIGIVSWVIPCAKGKPDVFTKVSSYLPWIHDAML